MTADRLPHSLLLATAALASACSAVPANGGDGTRRVEDATPFVMQSNERVVLVDGSQLHYVEVKEDSRCPPDTQCIWSGDAAVAFKWSPASGQSHTIVLHTHLEPRAQSIGQRTLELLELERGDAPAATLRVAFGD